MTLKNKEITEQRQTKTVAIRTEASPYQLKELMGTHFPAIYQMIKSGGREVTGQPYSLYRRFGEEHVDVELGMEVDKGFEPEGDYSISAFPTGRIVKAEFYGPYSKLSDGYEELERWVTGQGMVPTGPSWEIYMSDPMSTPDLNDLRTDIHILLEPSENTENTQ